MACELLWYRTLISQETKQGCKIGFCFNQNLNLRRSHGHTHHSQWWLTQEVTWLVMEYSSICTHNRWKVASVMKPTAGIWTSLVSCVSTCVWRDRHFCSSVLIFIDCISQWTKRFSSLLKILHAPFYLTKRSAPMHEDIFTQDKLAQMSFRGCDSTTLLKTPLPLGSSSVFIIHIWNWPTL